MNATPDGLVGDTKGEGDFEYREPLHGDRRCPGLHREFVITFPGELGARSVGGGNDATLPRARVCAFDAAADPCRTVAGDFSALHRLALVPVLWASGRGADLMQPMILPVVGGMVFDLLSLFSVPVFYAWLAREARE